MTLFRRPGTIKQPFFGYRAAVPTIIYFMYNASYKTNINSSFAKLAWELLAKFKRFRILLKKNVPFIYVKPASGVG